MSATPRQRAVLAAEQLKLLGVYSADAARRLGYDVPSVGTMARCAIRVRHCPRHACELARSVMPRLARSGGDRSR